MSGNDFFIVLSLSPDEHPSFAQAERVLASLRRHAPDKEHRIYRCKRWMQSAEHFPKLIVLLQDIARDGLTSENIGRMQVILATFAYRNRQDQTPNLTRVRRPQFSPRGANER